MPNITTLVKIRCDCNAHYLITNVSQLRKEKVSSRKYELDITNISIIQHTTIELNHFMHIKHQTRGYICHLWIPSMIPKIDKTGLGNKFLKKRNSSQELSNKKKVCCLLAN
jgi:hypothetical protein